MLRKTSILMALLLMLCGTSVADLTLTGNLDLSGTLGIDQNAVVALPRRVLPLGDSITRGSGDSPVLFGYRDHLQDLLGLGNSSFVGPYTDPDSDATYDVAHDGVGGDDTLNILARIESDLDVYLPAPNDQGNIVLLMIGTNDIKDGFVEGDTVDNVETIISAINTHDPSIDVYVALITPSTDADWNADFTSYNAALVTRLETLRASKSNLYYVDINTAFKTCNGGSWTGCLSDTLHPTDAGYQILANTWFACIQNKNAQYCNGN